MSKHVGRTALEANAAALLSPFSVLVVLFGGGCEPAALSRSFLINVDENII